MQAKTLFLLIVINGLVSSGCEMNNNDKDHNQTSDTASTDNGNPLGKNINKTGADQQPDSSKKGIANNIDHCDMVPNPKFDSEDTGNVLEREGEGDSTEVTQPEVNSCANCGDKSDHAGAFCGNCGFKRNAEQKLVIDSAIYYCEMCGIKMSKKGESVESTRCEKCLANLGRNTTSDDESVGDVGNEDEDEDEEEAVFLFANDEADDVYCQKCGVKSEPDARYCASCGENL